MDEHLEILRELSCIAGSSLDHEERIAHALNFLADRTGARFSALYLCGREEGPFVPAFSKGVLPSLEEGFLEKVAKGKGPSLNPDHPEGPVLATPLIEGGRCLGVMTFGYPYGGWPGEKSPEFFEIAGSILAGMVKGAQLHKEARHRLSELALLSEVGKALSSTLELPELLQLVVRLPASVITARGAILRLLDPATGELPIAASFGLEEGAVQEATLRLGEGIAGVVAQEGTPLLIPDVVKEERFAADKEHTSLICVPLRVKGKVIGTLGLYDKVTTGDTEDATFTEEDLQLLFTIASQAAIAIENSRLFTDLSQRLQEISALHTVAATAGQSLRIEEALKSALEKMLEIMNLEVGWVRVLDEETGDLVLAVHQGLSPRYVSEASLTKRSAKRLASQVVREGKPIVVDDVLGDPELADHPIRGEGLASFASIPLLSKGRAVGVMNVGSHVHHSFTPAEVRLLTAIGNVIGVALENTQLFQRMEELARDYMLRCKELSILHEIGKAMSGTIKLDRLLQVILTGVTFGGGLGFNRALLLLVNEKANVLQGVMGVGPASGEDAASIWEGLGRRGCTLEEIISDLEEGRRGDSAFDCLARNLNVPLVPEAGVLALTALAKKAILVRDMGNDPRVNPSFEGRLQVKSFATAPLIAKDKVVGVLVVDNKFNQQEIEEKDLEFLTLFANQAGLAIENAQIHARLEEVNRELQNTHHQLIQQEKFAVLGEMAANIVHEIRNPLVSIGGFARRLGRRLSPSQAEWRYTDIIVKEVERLERILTNVLSTSRDLKPSLAEVDLNEILEDCLILFEDLCERLRIKRRIELSGEILRVRVDVAQIKQAILNLLYNAMEAMLEGGELLVRTSTVRGEVTLEVGDSGGGIPGEILDQIFDPFFTTKEHGTGLGLTLASKIVKSHSGSIEVQNRPGEGATFLIRLPGL